MVGWFCRDILDCMAKWFIAAGALLLLIGVALQNAPWLVSWFGRLPGDISFESSGGTRVFIPITSMIVLSILLSVLVSLLRR